MLRGREERCEMAMACMASETSRPKFLCTGILRDILFANRSSPHILDVR